LDRAQNIDSSFHLMMDLIVCPSSNELYFKKGGIVMILARITLAIAIFTVIPVTSIYARDNKCDRLRGSEQADCYYKLAEEVAEDMLKAVRSKCRSVSTDPADRGYCTYDGMLATYEYAADRWQPKK